MDFSKAFDCIPRQNLFQKLLDNGITGKVFDSIRNLYNGDKTFLKKVNDKISQGIEVGKGVRQGCIMSPLLFNIFMADLPEKLSKKDSVSLEDKQKVNCLIWADDTLLLSETETGMNHMLKDLDVYCKTNGLTINFDKTKCMIFNKTGRLLRRNFILGNSKIETVRSYKYVGVVFTPSGEIKSSLEDLRSRALKAYTSLKHKLGDCFTTHIDETVKLFDTLIKSILMYSSDFWGCLKLPINNPIENLHMRYCKNILGVHRSTTNVGVLLEIGRIPIIITAQKTSINNWERIRNNNTNKLLISSWKDAKLHQLDWPQRIKSCLEQNGMLHYFMEVALPYATNIHRKLYLRLVDEFHQNCFADINLPNSKLPTCGLLIYNRPGGILNAD